jgi:hypothetical protein
VGFVRQLADLPKDGLAGTLDEPDVTLLLAVPPHHRGDQLRALGSEDPDTYRGRMFGKPLHLADRCDPENRAIR